MAHTRMNTATHPPIAENSNPKTLIVGLGKTGLSCARYLAAKGVSVAITDSRENPPGLAQLREELPGLAVFLGGFDAEAFAVAQRLVVSPGVSTEEPLIQSAVARGVPVLGDIELFARAARAPVAAITGSNGKSTVTTLLGEMARAAGWHTGVGGNLGVPALDLLADDCSFYVLELSSFQLESTQSLRPKAAVVLNVSRDHMDRYQDLEDYAAVKSKIYTGAEVGVVNRDDDQVMAMRGLARTELGFTLGRPKGSDYGLDMHAGKCWIWRGDEPLLPAAAIKIPGRHNLANALAALAMAEASGLPMSAGLQALKSFRGLEHRTQFVSEKKGVSWYNDSKATNVGATIAALEGMNSEEEIGRTVLIAGGEGKGADFSALADVVARTGRAAVLIGRDAELIASALEGSGLRILRAQDMNEAVTLAAAEARVGDRVLLSPACASFDMFPSFVQRGEAFISAVRRLPG